MATVSATCSRCAVFVADIPRSWFGDPRDPDKPRYCGDCVEKVLAKSEETHAGIRGLWESFEEQRKMAKVVVAYLKETLTWTMTLPEDPVDALCFSAREFVRGVQYYDEQMRYINKRITAAEAQRDVLRTENTRLREGLDRDEEPPVVPRRDNDLVTEATENGEA